MAVFAGAAAVCFCAGADAGEVLTLEECLRIAAENHPSVAGAAAQIDAERGRLKQAVVGDKLTVSGSASSERARTSSGEGASYSAGVSASAKIFDANRNKYSVDAQRYSLSGTEESARETLLKVRTNVKSAYMALLLSLETEKQRSESVDAFTRHLEQAQGFYKAGSKPWYDVTKAKVDLGNAELALIEAKGNVAVARRELMNAIGAEFEGPFEARPAELHLPGDAESRAEQTALENRPDYKAADLSVLAQRSTIEAEARGMSPTINVVGGYNTNGDQIYDLDRGWNAGVQLSVPVVDGGETKAKVETARAQLRSLEATREKLRQDIMLDVGKALTELIRTREQVRVSALTLEDAEENRKLAEGRYNAGVGTPLEVTDALLGLADAQLSSYNARYNLQIAIISLENAVGVEFN